MKEKTLDEILGMDRTQPNYCTYPGNSWVTDCYEAYQMLCDHQGETEPLESMCKECAWSKDK